jgi:hypothetical protein
MKLKKLGIGLGLASTLLFVQCDVLEDVAGEILGGATTEGITKPSLTNSEVISGLKEALTIGITNGANLSSMTDGFLKNDLIKLPFPPSAIEAKNYIDGLQDNFINNTVKDQLAKIELTLNRAAEESAKKAAPIFVDAIKNMSVSDGFAILKGGDDAATTFLQKNTTAKLVEAFSPVVADAIAKVKLTDYWNPVVSKYNVYASLTGKNEITTDLSKYVTDRAISGLFTMVKQEEKKIRKDPIAQVTDLLKKVFGSVMGQ